MRGDEANAALSRAVNKLIREPGSRINHLRVWDQIDNLDHADLDELAWELNVDWYSTDLSLEAKRQTIKYAQRIQSKRGTKWAVERLVSAYFGHGRVREWFETDGEPYTFSVEIINTELADMSVERFLKAVNAAKSARSHLSGIRLEHELPAAYVDIHTRPRRVASYSRIILDYDLHFNYSIDDSHIGIAPVVQVYQRTILN
jgi:phage tail P2-like protein